MDIAIPDLWRLRLAAFSSSGLTLKDWCAAEGVSHRQFYYWRDRLNVPVALCVNTKQDAGVWALASIVEPDPPTSIITVFVGDVEIDLVSGFDPELLREIVVALTGRVAC